MFLYTINQNEAQQRLDKYLKKILKNAPDSFIYKMIRKKNIVLNGKKCDGKEKLNIGDEIKLFFSDETFEKFSGQKVVSTSSSSKEAAIVETKVEENQIKQYINAYKTIPDIGIVFENEHILVVNKPQGILSQKAEINDISVNEWFIGYLLDNKKITKESLATFKPSICNRLDRNTSGMVICGKTLPGSQFLSEIIKSKDLQKFYYCLVPGHIDINERLTGYLYKDKNSNKVTIYKNEKEVPARLKESSDFIDTSFKTLSQTKDCTLIEVQLFTGKTHQIRAHLASIGHPIIGDKKYGNANVNAKYSQYKLKGQLLHAKRLVFPSISESNQRFKDLSLLTLTCDEPDIFKTIMQ